MHAEQKIEITPKFTVNDRVCYMDDQAHPTGQHGTVRRVQLITSSFSESYRIEYYVEWDDGKYDGMYYKAYRLRKEHS